MSQSLHNALGTAVVTGASTGIGATYADRLAKRGYDLILVARNEAKLNALADRLRAQTQSKVRVLKADLTDKADVAAVEAVLSQDPSITLLVNNAGSATPGPFAGSNLDDQAALIGLNVTAVVRLAGAAIPGFLARGTGAIINIASVLAYGAEVMPGVYSATKAFVMSFSQGLQAELGEKVHVQVVLPAATRTEIWGRTGVDIDSLPPGSVMSVDDLVDAALVGFDLKEKVTIPPLHDEGLFKALETTRFAMMQTVRQEKPAARYRAPAKTASMQVAADLAG